MSTNILHVVVSCDQISLVICGKKMLYHENKAREDGYKFVAGVDEAGRGPLAGPVVACALILKSRRFKERVADSKKLTALQRSRAFAEIIRKSFFGLGWVDQAEIDSLNILEATRLAMKKAIDRLICSVARDKKAAAKNLRKKCCFLIDGNFFKAGNNLAVKNIIHGENKSLSIAAASIIAKVSRDRLMASYDKKFPGYGFSRHKGYGTRGHMAAIKRLGPCSIHRRSFYPLTNEECPMSNDK